MTHQTGIKPNERLLEVFRLANNGEFRAIKVSISNEQLTCSETVKGNGLWNEEYDTIVKSLVEENVPCYILYRFDEKSALGYFWLFLDWIPETSTTREKMVYASTKATLKSEFGSSYIKEHLNATSFNEISLSAYKNHKREFSVPAPLTNREDELKHSEVCTDINTDTRQKTFQGLSCALTISAENSLQGFRGNSNNYAQFKIDIKKELIDLVKDTNILLENLPNEIPKDAARYHIFLFEHLYEGSKIKSFLFIYSMPGYMCPVKERMMYSSCKSAFIEKLQLYGIEISKMLEIDDGSELTPDQLYDHLHPRTNLGRPKFSKPKGPPNRGAKRMTKPQTSK